MTKAAEMSKTRRNQLKRQGLCPNCGKTPPETGRVICSTCLEKARVSHKRYIENNPKAKEVKKRWKNNPKSREKHREARKRWRLRLKRKVLISLGGKCECCAETQLDFLQVDHVNKDGKKHREEIGRSVQMHKDMLKHPTRYKLRVLCANCHFSITNTGICPHQKDKNELLKIQQDIPCTMV